MNLKKIERYLLVNLLGPGPSSYKKRIYRAAVSQRLRNTALKQTVNRIIRENRHFTISEVYEQCPEVSRTVVYKLATEHLQHRKISARWARRPSGTRRE
jgi:hypothetical protein